MLSIGEIRQNCYTTTYNKGRELFLAQDFRDIEIGNMENAYDDIFDEDMGTIQISGSVKGSGRKWYLVHVNFDSESDVITEYECECPAYDNYYGMCKHCVALALYYREEQMKSGQVEYSLLEVQKHPDIVKETSVALKFMLERYGHQGKGYIFDRYNHEIQLIPQFSTYSYRGNLEVEFKIGANKLYVVKNIAAVIYALDSISNYAYGKNLSFIHDRTVFTDEALSWIDIMRDVLKTEKGIDNFEKYSTSYYNNDMRHISLGGYGVEKCLQHYIGSQMKINLKMHTVVDGNPTLTLNIRQQDDHGANLSITPVKYLNGNQHYYIIDNDCIYQCSPAFSDIVLPLLQAMRAIQNSSAYPIDPLYLSSHDYRLFCKNMLPILESQLNIVTVGIDFDEYTPEEVLMRVYLNMTDNDRWQIEAKCEAVINDNVYDIYNSDDALEYRDITAEFELKQIIERYFSSSTYRDVSGLYCDDDELILNLVQEGIGALQQLAEVYVDEKIRRIQLKPAPKVSIGISIQSELLELSIQNDLMHPDEIYQVLSAYKKKKKYYRLKNGDIIQLEDTGLGLLAELSDGLMLKQSQIEDGTIEIPKFRVKYIDDAIRRLSGEAEVHRDHTFRKMVRDMRDYSDSDFDIPATVHAKLRKYQKEGFRWLATLASYGLGGILADDMGLGKTLQILTFLSLNKPRTLIICPASLVYNWESEIQKFTPELNVIAVTGSATAREKLLNDLQDVDIVVTSYDLLKRDVEVYCHKKFECIVIDEAQYIKNAGTLAARAVKRIPAGIRFALTGTPIENRLSDLWSIFDFIMPGYLYAYARFKSDFEQSIVNGGDEKVLARLKDMISPFILRRKKRDVLKDLPDKLEETIYTKMNDEQERLYKAMASRLAMELAQSSDDNYQNDRIRFLAELTRLRQVCCAPDLCFEDYKGGSGKMDACMDLIESAISGGHHILVFSQFTQMLEKLIDAYKEKGDYLYLSGKSSKESRKQMVDLFQKGNIPVFFISLKAGGTGLNLTAADMVIHFDPWWNVAAQNQATDRTHRIGQKNVVTVMKLVMKNTIEEKIIALQEEKARLAEDVIEGKAASDYRISREELLDLLK